MARIVGTDGADVLNGASENDKIYGLGGNDDIHGGDGDDLLVGGDGDDRIDGGRGSDTIDAGAGNDDYHGYYPGGGTPEKVRVSMGDGDDDALFGNGGGGTANLDLGAGDDRLLLHEASATTITTGAGSDSIELLFDYRPGAMLPVVTDFTAGAGGDSLTLTGMLGEVLTGWKGMNNPFARGFLRLVQDGADTLVGYDRDGDRHGARFIPVIRLAGVDATAFGAENLAGFAPDGSTAPSLRVNDVNLPGPFDRFNGSTGGDRIHGGDGDDSIDGGVGGDRIWGETGDDTLRGDAGNDRLYGGDGSDTIWENGGSNFIDGGAGEDIVYFEYVVGGTSGGGGDETILLGDGYDRAVYQNFRSGSLTLDMGNNDDQLELYSVQDGGARITTGTGSDLITVKWDFRDHFLTAFEVTDFTAGTGGDQLDVRELLHFAAPGWDGGNPFAEGFVRLSEAGGATLVEVDRDGAGGPGGFTTLAKLDGVVAAKLNAFNFGGLDPQAVAAEVGVSFIDRHHADWSHLALA